MSQGDNPELKNLIERDVEPLTYPDRLYAIGGAGKSVVFELLQQDWFLVEAMRGGSESSSGTLKIIILDTAGGERRKDAKSLDGVSERIDTIKEIMRDHSGINSRNIKIIREYITDHINTAGPADFLSKNVKRQIAESTDAEYWWVNNENLLDEDSNLLDFSEGVIRRRALSKAFYYKAKANASGLDNTLQLSPGDEKIAVIAGLGGGTGSGVCLDIARHLKENANPHRTTLFGVLPTHLENDKKKANAYAALSELEYSYLKKDHDVYENIVLLPSNPTNYSGDAGEGFRQFDSAFAYTLLAFYNHPGNVIHKRKPGYAPFTMAVPQVLRYDVEATKEAKEFAQELLEGKERAQELESEVYEEVVNFLESNYGSTEVPELTESEIDIIYDKIDRFEQLVEFPLFGKLEYVSVDHGQEAINNIYEDDPGEDIDSLIANVDFAIQNAFSRPGIDENSREIDRMDEWLDDLLKRELELVRDLYRILKYRKQVDESPIDRMLEFFVNLDQDASSGQSVFKTISGKHTEASREVEQLAEELDELNDKIETRRKESKSEVDGKVRSWKQSVRGDVETMLAVANVSIGPELDRLYDDLNTYARDIESADSSEAVGQIQSNTEGTVRDIEDRLQAVDVSTERLRNDVQRSTELLARAREKWIEMNETPGIVGRILGGGRGSGDAQSVYTRIRNDLQEHGIYSVPAPTAAAFEVTVDSNVGGQLEADLDEQYEAALEAIVQAFEAEINDVDESTQRELVAKFESTVVDYIGAPDTLDSLATEVRDALAQGRSGVGDLENRRDRVAEKLEAAKAEKEAYGAAGDLLDRCLSKEMDFKDHQSEFVAKLQRETFTPQQDEAKESKYITKIQPENIVKAINSDSLTESNLFSPRNDVDERKRVEDHFQQLVNERFSNRNYSGVEHSALKIDSQPATQFTMTTVNFAVMSSALDGKADDRRRLYPRDLDFESDIKDIYNLRAADTNDSYENWTIENGHSWDVSAVMFVKGISFLDNIRNVGAGGSQGYKRAFEDKLSRASDQTVRHAYGLEKGYYVYRDDILNLSDDEERRVVLDQDADDIVDAFIDQTVTVEGVGERLKDEPEQTVE